MCVPGLHDPPSPLPEPEAEVDVLGPVEVGLIEATDGFGRTFSSRIEEG